MLLKTKNITATVLAFSFFIFFQGCSDMGIPEANLHIVRTAHYSIRQYFHIENSGNFPDSLAPIYPNPFNHNNGDVADTIVFTLRDTGNVKIIIQNPIGDSVAIFRDTLLPPGIFTGSWEPLTTDGIRLRAGLYFVTIRIAPNDPDRNYINSRLLQIQSNE